MLMRDEHPDIRASAGRRSFAFNFHRFESVLDLTAFDETAHQGVQERLAGDGITFQDMGTPGQDEANWTRLYTFFADQNQETPDMQGNPRMIGEQARHELREHPMVAPEGIVLATRGEEWLGMSMLMLDPRSPDNFFTGVRPDARGLGLARALKLDIIHRAKAAGSTQLLMHNHSANGPMLAVNLRLGYQSQPGMWMMRRPLL